MWGRGWNYFAQAEGLPLSLKCVSNGRANYRLGRRYVAVDDTGWLIVNENQPYSIEIESPTLVDTFIVWFPRGWADDVWRGATSSDAELLTSAADANRAPHFSEHYTPNEPVLAPAVHALRASLYAGQAPSDARLEEQLRDVLARMFDVHHELRMLSARVPAMRVATREELLRRLQVARDLVHARCQERLTLAEIAAVASLSPYHFQRSFKKVFRQTPHEWLTVCRLERTKFLLARTELQVTEICAAVGYESLGSFSTSFQRRTGCSPREWRRRNGSRTQIRNNREVFPA